MVKGRYLKAVRQLGWPDDGCLLCLCIRLAQLSSSGSLAPHCSCSAGLWVRTSGRDSLELEGISRQMRLCQPSREHPPLPSAPGVITESVRRIRQFLASLRVYLCPVLGTGGDCTATAKDLLGAPVSGCTSKSLSFLPFPAGREGTLQVHKRSVRVSKDSDEGRGCPGCQKQLHQPRIFSSSLGNVYLTLSVLCSM